MNKYKVGLIMSCTMAVISALLLYQYTNDMKKQFGFDQLVPVVVAKLAIPTGAVLNKNQIEIRDVPLTFAHPNAVHATDLETVLGRKLNDAIKAGQPLLWNDLWGGRSGPDRLSELVQEGARALTIPVDPKLALGGMVRPNDRVDILLTYTNREDQRTTRTILQNVLVTAVGVRMNDTPGPSDGAGDRLDHQANNVTVLLKPEDTELMVYAVDRGRIALTLRNQADQEPVKLTDRNFSQLLGDSPPQHTEEPRPVSHERLPEVLDLLQRGRR